MAEKQLVQCGLLLDIFQGSLPMDAFAGTRNIRICGSAVWNGQLLQVTVIAHIADHMGCTIAGGCSADNPLEYPTEIFYIPETAGRGDFFQ